MRLHLFYTFHDFTLVLEMKDKCVFIGLASPLHKPEVVDAILKHYYGLAGNFVDEFLGKVTSEKDIRKVDVGGVACFVCVVLTGGAEHLVLEIARRGVPLALIAHDTQNSLAAALEAKARLDYERLYAELFTEKNLKYLEDFVKAAKAVHKVRGSKLLLVGEPSPWLIYSSLSIEEFKKILGLSIDIIPVEELIREYHRVTDGDVEKELLKLKDVEVVEPSKEDVVDSIRLYVALRNLVRKYSADFVSIRCFDLLEHKVTACLPLSILNDEGIIAGCEGDVPATLTMALMYHISGKPVFMGNVVWVEEDKVFFAHCTTPTRIMARFKLRSHFESGLGVAVEGYPRVGEKATFARIDPVGRVLRIGVGRIVNSSPISENVCRTQIQVRVQGNPFKLIEEPIGNHYVLALGNVVCCLKYVAKLLKLRLETIG